MAPLPNAFFSVSNLGVSNGGIHGTPGTQIVTGTSGEGTAWTGLGTINSSGVLTGIVMLNGGLYNTAPTSPDPIYSADNMLQGATAALITTALQSEVNVKTFGALGDWSTDDSAAIQAAANFCLNNNFSLFFPDGVYRTSVGLIINCDVRMTSNAVIQATASMPYVVSVGSTTTIVRHKKWVGGNVDCHNFATDGIFLRNVQHYTITQVAVTDPVTNAFHVGDSGTSSPSFEVHAYDLRCDKANDWWDTGLATGIVANTVGFYFENCTDSSLSTSEFIQMQYGCRANLSSILFDKVHNYPHPGGFMHYAFWDAAISNVYINCHADTPSQYGWYFSSTGAAPKMIAPRATNNNIALTGVPIVIYFNGLNNPAATIVGMQVGDAGSGSIFLKDMDSTGSLSTANICLTGTQYFPSTCVTTKNMNTNVYPVTG